MNDRRDLQLVLDSGTPIVIAETRDETRLLELLVDLGVTQRAIGYRPLYRWTVTDGMQRLDLALERQQQEAEPEQALRQIRSADKPGIYALLDFHPFLTEPVNVRLLKDVALAAPKTRTTVILIGHRVELPAELQPFAARFALRLPDPAERLAIVNRCVDEYGEEHAGVRVDQNALKLLVKNLGGLTHADIERLARNAIRDDGAITAADVPAVTQAKYQLLNRGGVLSFEYETAKLEDLAGFGSVKRWLERRRGVFGGERPRGLDAPKGLLLIGVQGCGKSLAAKAAASVFGVPLLRLDFSALYNKYHGETERNLRESLQTADVMSPCVLWLDEIEKGLATGNDESGTSRRVLGVFLTWMAERKAHVFLVATANDVHELPPELIRKGRFDEIFFVDLPTEPERTQILAIHLKKRALDPRGVALAELVRATDGFSGAEIEQGIVAALYSAHASGQPPQTAHFLAELESTRPLSVLLAERMSELREWARGRTVPAQ
ncbi:MAG TPA: AAA family ATPase [Gammaproteobacteria bacterium]|nr:AAA family ATPase [Gammaproteobacteria bacterium]